MSQQIAGVRNVDVSTLQHPGVAANHLCTATARVGSHAATSSPPSINIDIGHD